MQFRVRVCRMAAGERLPLVVDPHGLPVPMPHQWALLLRRPQVQSATLIEEMRTVTHIHEWAMRRGIDLDARFVSGKACGPRSSTHSIRTCATCDPRDVPPSLDN